mgnify:CR=1 FL=1
MDIKIARFILPYHLKRDNRIFIAGCAHSILEMGNAIRYNGNGGLDNPINIDHEMVYQYLTTDPFFDLISKLPKPDEQQKLNAYKIALQSFPNMKTWEQKDQDMLLASVFSIYGYNNNPSDLILIYKGSFRPSSTNHQLYLNAIKLAKASGIKIKYLCSS